MKSSIPAQLRRRPFSVADARHAGLSWDDLQSKRWVRLSRGQYSWRGLTQDATLTLRAVERRMPPEHAFSGLTAAWILGLDVPPCEPVEVTVGRDVPIRARAGVRLRRAFLPESDVTTFRGFRTTKALRTVCDVGSGRDLVESVVAIDMALHARLVDLSELTVVLATHAGDKGVKRLRRAVRLADARSESPMETRLRLALVSARLPRPCVQAEIMDNSGGLIGRVDLYYPDRRLVIEYDGAGHKERIAPDARRQNALVNAGYHVLRFTAADLRVPWWIAAQVRRARSLLAPFPDSPDIPN